MGLTPAMFDKPFPVTKINSQKKKIVDDVHIYEHNFFFRGKKDHRYNVIVEQYDFSTYIIKFYLNKHKNRHNRFELLTALNECSRVLCTVSRVLRELLNDDPFASFGFIGSPCQGEEKNNTKRFRLYKMIVENFVSPIQFTHHTLMAKSAYLLLNKDNTESNLLNKIELYFASLYPDLDTAINN